VSRTPNSEQIKAIEHTGGVLLKAGAGSGKTFVLVEHIVYLTRMWISEFRKKPTGTFEEKIRFEFSRIVMMTFTKKAAGEMSIRLTDRFQELRSSDELWEVAASNLPVLLVTTIDGFCRKLITGGYLPHLSTEAKVIFWPERMDQVKLIYEKWFATEAPKLDGALLDLVLREKNEILNGLCGVFSDSSLRMAWADFSPKSLDEKAIGKVLHDSFYLENLDQDLSAIQLVELPPQDLGAYEKNIQLLQNTGLPVVDSVEKLTIYAEIFSNIRLSAPSKNKKTPITQAAHEATGRLKDWIKPWKVSVDSFMTHGKDKVIPWATVFKEIFRYVEKRLDPNQGMTFADIEYFVELGLRDPEINKRVREAYRYFIVDEFQDTSGLQFEIIRSLIDNNFRNLFCVGDPKQAIYGFRGGELSVFQNCSKLVPSVLTLANNYRSLPDVIRFNNSLFECVLPLGKGFEDADPFTVEAEGQTIPPEITHEAPGEIEVLRLNLTKEPDDKRKLSYEHMNRLEAQMLVKAVTTQRENKPTEVCTILYRKLPPSIEFIQGLMNEKVGFTAQYKIDLMDDPIMGIFVTLLQRIFDEGKETKNKTPLFLIKNYFSILGIDELPEIRFEEFDHNMRYWGLYEAFKKFVFGLNITNENSDVNLDQIETFCKLYHQNPEAILLQLDGDDAQKVSLEFRSGNHSDMVHVMTAHSSKGLEYDNIYLGGIYTNGHEMPMTDLLAKWPESFYYYTDLQTHQKIRSPHYVLEAKMTALKNFSESKRLFYVACTRAKKKLCWAHLENIGEMSKLPGNSWIVGFNKWWSDTRDEDLRARVKETLAGELTLEDALSGKSNPTLPLFFYDPVGVHKRQGERAELALMAELSVTRLNSLMDCPRKFYFENILKLTSIRDQKRSFVPEESDEVQVRSSSQRGTLIHEILSTAIQRNFVIPREHFQGEHQKPLAWAIGAMESFRKDFDFVSEKPLKFKFFNFMISGIPDLLLLPKKSGTPAEIWDFKTGRITQESLNHYWVQLKAYAYALYVLGMVPREDSIETKLCFVDEQKFLNLSVNWTMVHEDLFAVWKTQNEPWMTKTDHCSQCSYGDICPR
jgi:ATP-dependent exoDNAse (exonuclease V) beta subunit